MNRLDAPQGEQAVVIVAGYHEGVEKFLQYNDGMDRRIGSENRFVLRNYTCDELANIICIKFREEGYSVDCSHGHSIMHCKTCTWPSMGKPWWWRRRSSGTRRPLAAN